MKYSSIESTTAHGELFNMAAKGLYSCDVCCRGVVVDVSKECVTLSSIIMAQRALLVQSEGAGAGGGGGVSLSWENVR